MSSNTDIKNVVNSDHPYHFYRDKNPDLPLREATPSTSRYTPLFETLRERLLAELGYQVSKSIEEFEPDADRIAQWTDLAWEGDRIGDNLARMFKELPAGQGRKLFEHVLEHGLDGLDDPHSALVELDENINSIPDLFDLNKVKRGSDVLAEIPLVSFYFGLISQLGVGSNYGAVGRMVGASGRFFDVKGSASRLLETMKFVMGDLTSEDLFQRDSDSLKDAYRVRLMHAFVRAHAMQSDDKEVYNFEERGNPVNMLDTVGGGPVFGVAPVAMDIALGGKQRSIDVESITEVGRIVAYINGVNYNALPESIHEFALLYDYQWSMHEGLGAYAEDLNRAIFVDVTQAIVDGQQSWIASKLLSAGAVLASSLIQWSHGKALCQQAGGVQSGWGVTLGLLFFPAFKYSRIVFDKIDRHLPGYQQRRVKRRAAHRKFYSETVIQFLQNSLHQQVDMKFDKHDRTTKDALSNKPKALV